MLSSLLSQSHTSYTHVFTHCLHPKVPTSLSLYQPFISLGSALHLHLWMETVPDTLNAAPAKWCQSFPLTCFFFHIYSPFQMWDRNPRGHLRRKPEILSWPPLPYPPHHQMLLILPPKHFSPWPLSTPPLPLGPILCLHPLILPILTTSEFSPL